MGTGRVGPDQLDELSTLVAVHGDQKAEDPGSAEVDHHRIHRPATVGHPTKPRLVERVAGDVDTEGSLGAFGELEYRAHDRRQQRAGPAGGVGTRRGDRAPARSTYAFRPTR